MTQKHSEEFYIRRDELMGVVKYARNAGMNLSARVMLENLISKASNIILLVELRRRNNFGPGGMRYVVDCRKRACEDMDQRGGGNFAKTSAEIVGYGNTTNSNVRGFCTGPVHAMIRAAAPVKPGTFGRMIATAGGCTIKLGINGESHVKKGLPVLGDCITGFSALISKDDDIHPIIRTDIMGCHKVGTGSTPQVTINSLMAEPLEKVGLTFTDTDKYAPELRNPDITKPAGTGDVPEINCKVIAALAVIGKQIQRMGAPSFVKKHRMTD